MSIISQPKKQILLKLANEPKHGYEIAKLANLPMGSIYDHLAELVQEGFIKYTEDERRKIYQLTKKGKMLLKILK
jgi:DNA-binding PadR family transcriptional regulator